MDKPIKIKVGAAIDPDIYEELLRRASEQRLSLSSLINSLLYKAIKE